eukprot:1426903-Amphidinium_carterae.1
MTCKRYERAACTASKVPTSCAQDEAEADCITEEAKRLKLNGAMLPARQLSMRKTDTRETS